MKCHLVSQRVVRLASLQLLITMLSVLQKEQPSSRVLVLRQRLFGRTYVCVRPQQDVLELRLLLVDVFDGLLGLIVRRCWLQNLRALCWGLALALQGKLILLYSLH